MAISEPQTPILGLLPDFSRLVSNNILTTPLRIKQIKPVERYAAWFAQKNEKQRQLVNCVLQKAITHIRKKRTLPSTGKDTTVSVEDVSNIFQECTKGHIRASFTPEQTAKILSFFRKEKADPIVSIYSQIANKYDDLKRYFPEDIFISLVQKLIPEYEEIKNRREKLEPIKSIESYVKELGKISDKNHTDVAKQLLFKFKNTFNFISDLLENGDILLHTHDKVDALAPDTFLISGRYKPILIELISNLKTIQDISEKIQELEASEERNEKIERTLSDLKKQLTQLTKKVNDSIEIWKLAFEKYVSFSKRIESLPTMRFEDKDHFMNISHLIHHEEASAWEKFPKLKRDFIFNLSLFFDKKNLKIPKEADSLQGPDFDKIDSLVKDAIKKVQNDIRLDGEDKIRIYSVDKTQHIEINSDDIKHVAERHYAPTLNPSVKKLYNTKFKKGMTLEKIVKTIYERLLEDKEGIFSTLQPYYSSIFSLDGQQYCIGIEIQGNREIEEGNNKIKEGDAKIANGQDKLKNGTSDKEKGEGRTSIKIGRSLKEAGQALVVEGMQKKKMTGAYRFKQFYPEPRNAVVFFMSPQNISNPKSNKEFRELLAAFGRRYEGYQIPATYYAITYHPDSTFSRWQLESDPRLAGAGEETWRPIKEKSLSGVYTKVTMVGHGSHNPEGGMVIQEGDTKRTIEPRIVGQSFASLFSDNDTRIQHIRLLACHQNAEVFSEELSQPLKEKKIQIEQIIGSESEVYIVNKGINWGRGTKAASKYYGVDLSGRPVDGTDARRVEAVKRGAVKWVVDFDANGNREGVPRRVTSHGSGTDPLLEIARHSDAISGPFGNNAQELAQQLRQVKNHLSEAREELKRTLTAIHAAANEAKNMMAVISGRDQSLWFVDTNQVRTDGNKVWVSVRDKETHNGQEVELSQERGSALLAAQERLKGVCKFLKPYFERLSDGHLLQKATIQPVGVPNQPVGAPHTLNVGFLAMALIEELRNRGSEMPLETQIDIYLNFTGTTLASVQDLIEFGKLIAPSGIVTRSLEAVSRIFEVGNVVFMLGALGWNIYELATTTDPVNRVGLGIQVGFTSGAVILQGGSMAATWALPAFAAGTAVSALAVPLLVAGTGFAVFGMQLEQHNREAHALFQYLIKAKKAYQDGGFIKKGDVRIPNPGAVITKLDFPKQEVTFGSQQLKKSKYDGWYVPSFSYDYENYQWKRFNFREALGIQERSVLDTTAKEMLLPSTPHLNVDYRYWNVLTRMTGEEAAISEELGRTGHFSASNSDGTLKAGFDWNEGIRSAPLTLDVVLDEQDRTLWFSPQVDSNMSYTITGGSGNVKLMGLHAGVRASLKEGKIGSFHLGVKAPLLHENDVTLRDGILEIQEAPGKTIRIDVRNLRGTVKVVGTAASWNIHLNTGKIQLLALDLRMVPHVFPINYLHNLTAKGLTENFVVVVSGPLPPSLNDNDNASEEEKKTYWEQLKKADEQAVYDVYTRKRDSLLTPANEIPSLYHRSSDLRGIQFVGVVGEKQFFFFDTEKKKLWSIDQDILLRTDYELAFINGKTRIEAVGESHHRMIVKQKTPWDPSKLMEEVTLIHVLEADKIRLIGMKGLSSAQFKKLVNFLKDSSSRKNQIPSTGNGFSDDAKSAFRQATGLRAQIQQEGDLAVFQKAEISEWVSIEGLDEDGISQRILAHFGKGYRIPVADHFISDLQPIKSWTTGKKDSFLFWSASNKKMYFAQAEDQGLQLALSEVDTDPVLWYETNKNSDPVDLITESGEGVIRIDSEGRAIEIMVPSHEWADSVTDSNFSETVLATV